MSLVSKFHPWNSQASTFGAVALAASAGGLSAFRAVLSRLPSDFPVPVLIVQHRTYRDSGQDVLVEILQKHSKLTVVQAADGALLRAGTAYVSPPNRQFLVASDGRISLRDHVASNRHRPSIDELFASLASYFGRRLIVAVLTGSLDDGAQGVTRVKAKSGRVLVQEPKNSFAVGMPSAAIATGCADFVLPLERIADALITLSMVPGANDLFPSPLISPVFA
jgi:two-component system, chemotaxis family, protein-glutamate methylesterase/glutaminase